MSEYQKQSWNAYDEDLSLEENIGKGAVATPERMEHMEEGIAQANKPYTAGTVTSGEAGTDPSVTVNEDKSIDFVIPKGEQGEEGESAYEIWKAQPGNESKTEEEFLASLVGPAGVAGEEGQSAYEIWVAQPGNEGKTEEEFLAALKGEKGETGAQGEKGEKGDPFRVAKTYASVEEMNAGYASDGVPVGQFVMITTGDVNDEDNAKLYVKGETEYEFVTDLSGAQGIKGDQGEQGPAGADGAKGDKGDQGEQGPAGADGADGADGQSAYELWKAQPGNENKTEEEFLASLKGEKGDKGDQGDQGPAGADGAKGDKGDQGDPGPAGADGEDGQSAYELWKAQPGNESKTEEEFLASLKGEKGDKGDQGEKGDKGEPFAVAKTYASVEEMNAGYATDGVLEGQFVMITTGDVNDEDNAKLYVKGSTQYDFVTDLSGAQGIKGDQGEQGPAGADGAKGDKGDQGEQGPAGANGQSAYELWKAQPGNESKTEEEFLASLKGEKGDKGDQGEQGPAGADGQDGAPGAQGEKGEKGDPGVTFVKGASVETGAWVDQTGVFKAEVTVSGLVAGDMVVMNLGHDTYDVAKTAEVRPYTVCEDGKFAIYATTAPTATITIDYAVFKAPVA